MHQSKPRKDPKQMSIKELEEYISKNKNENVGIKVKESKENEVPLRVNTSFSNTKINNSTFSSCPGLNYNYLDNAENQKNIPNYYEEPENIIKQLQKENNELKSDIKNLFFYTDQNKNELQANIAKLSEENYKIKKENFELKNKILLQENIIKNLEADKTEFINEKNIIKKKYENEIIELNCQLNDHKTRLNAINFEYQNLLQNYHKLKEEVILEQKSFSKIQNNNNKEEQKQSTIEEVRNLKEYLVKYDNSINEIKNKLSIIGNNTTNSKNNENHFTNSSLLNKRKKSNYISLTKNKSFNSKSKIPNRQNEKNTKKKNGSNILTSSSVSSFTKLNTSSSKKLNTNEINNQNYSTLHYIEEEIVALERKIADLNVSYQSFLNKLKNLPNNNFKHSQDLKETLKFLEKTINDKNEKLQQLKQKQQKFLIKSYKSQN